MPVFKLPDLGEGLPDAEIVEWHVAEGDLVEADQPMVSMETAKAVVEVPAPFSGKITRLHGKAGDVIDTGAPLVTFDGDGEDDQPAVAAEASPASPEEERAEAEQAADAAETAPPPAEDKTGDRPDSGTVVGAMESSDQVVREQVSQVGDYRVTPAVRALARKMKVDLSGVEPSGAGGVITAQDVRTAAEQGPSRPAAPPSRPSAPAQRSEPAPRAKPSGEWEPVRGTRRTMARVMSEAHAKVVPTSITEVVDVALWEGRQDMTVRMIRALCAGAQREPGLNAWFDGDGPKRLVHGEVNVGIAVDTPDGLFVSTLRNADTKSPRELRENLNQLRENVQNRSIPPSDLTGYTIMLSNVGVYAGQYTTPVITPPCVAILATGKMRDQVVASHGAIAVHPVIPLSLTFDHRAVTGGEAARFLAAFIEDLGLPS